MPSDPDAYPIIFRRALAQYLEDSGVGVYNSDGANYAAGERGIYPKGTIPTYAGSDNCIVENWLSPIPDGRANMLYRVQLFSRVKGDRTAAENFAALIEGALDQKQNIPAGHNVSWVELFSALALSADTSGRCGTYQTFHFSGRRPQ